MWNRMKSVFKRASNFPPTAPRFARSRQIRIRQWRSQYVRSTAISFAVRHHSVLISDGMAGRNMLKDLEHPSRPYPFMGFLLKSSQHPFGSHSVLARSVKLSRTCWELLRCDI